MMTQISLQKLLGQQITPILLLNQYLGMKLCH